MTESEIYLWSKLKSKSIMNYKFRRQHSVGAYILDFYCPEKRLAIEVDGSHHYSKDGKEYDNNREKFLESLNILVLRFSNREIINNINEVLSEINRNL